MRIAEPKVKEEVIRMLEKTRDFGYFIFQTGGGEYKDDLQNRYHFKSGIPGSLQLKDAENNGRFVYFEGGKFYARGEMGSITSYEENGITYYYAEVKNYQEMEPVEIADLNLSFGSVGQPGIRKISKEDYEAIVGFKESYLDRVFWKFSPGDNAKYWNDFSGIGIAAMGSWGAKIGNLKKYATAEDIRKSFPGKIVKSINPQCDSASQLLRFKDDVKPGHVFVAYGNKSIYGFGRVPEDSEYEFDDNENVNWWEEDGDTLGRQHWRLIDWFKIFEEPVDISENLELYNDLKTNDTIHKIKASLAEKLEEMIRGSTISAVTNVQHLVYKIAWHPGGYKGGFCGDATSEACEGFGFIKAGKKKKTCSKDTYHCIDEHEAFAESGWKVKIHPPRVNRLNELVEGKSLVFLVAPLDKSKAQFRTVGFYTIGQKEYENGKVAGLSADRKLSSKFDLTDEDMKKSSANLKAFFGITKWSNPRTSYEFISSQNALKALNEILNIYSKRQIIDPDVNLIGMKSALRTLQRRDESEMDPGAKITIYDYLLSKSFSFDESSVSAFYVSLKTKGFVILAGLTGTGKTKLPRFVQDLVVNDGEQKLFLSVRPDWRDGKPLIGYFNPIEGKYETQDLLRLIQKSCKNWGSEEKLPFMVLLDEMNLARVEYYFADFLSVLESGRNKDLCTDEPIRLHALKSCQTSQRDEARPEYNEVLPKYYLPPNIYFSGTVNLDETTYSFSPKVLDRAFVIEFCRVDLENYPPRPKSTVTPEATQMLKTRIRQDLSRNGKYSSIAKEDVEVAINSMGLFFRDLKVLNSILEGYNLHFGYRVVDEIAMFFYNALESKSRNIVRFDSDEEIVDWAIMMKILPKIYGNRGKVEVPLRRIFSWSLNPDEWEKILGSLEENGALKMDFQKELNKGPAGFMKKMVGDQKVKYSRTAEKVARMMYQLYTTGFTGFL